MLNYTLCKLLSVLSVRLLAPNKNTHLFPILKKIYKKWQYESLFTIFEIGELDEISVCAKIAHTAVSASPNGLEYE